MLEHAGVTTTLQTDENDNIVLDFPTELLEVLEWQEGNVLDIQIFAGRIVISKVSDGESGGGNPPN